MPLSKASSASLSKPASRSTQVRLLPHSTNTISRSMLVLLLKSLPTLPSSSPMSSARSCSPRTQSGAFAALLLSSRNTSSPSAQQQESLSLSASKHGVRCHQLSSPLLHHTHFCLRDSEGLLSDHSGISAPKLLNHKTWYLRPLGSNRHCRPYHNNLIQDLNLHRPGFQVLFLSGVTSRRWSPLQARQRRSSLNRQT